MQTVLWMQPLFSTRLVSVPLALVMAGLMGCANDRPLRIPDVSATIAADMGAAEPSKASKSATVPARVSDALAEPAPPSPAPIPEPRLDLLVNNAQAREVFLAIVADTRYSMLMHPDVSGTLSVTLRGVTVIEALEAIRDVYGYDFKVEGRRITVYAPTLQTRIFSVNYPSSQRSGTSDLRVIANGTQSSGSNGSGSGSNGSQPAGSSTSAQSASVQTTAKTDFWSELSGAVKGLVGNGEGRSVIASPQAGIMAVRAMPDELRQVDKFLKAAKLAVERQVMLEAKIVEVELRDGFQSGIDWSALKNGNNSTGAIGVMSGNTTSNTLVSGVQANLPGFPVSAESLLADAVSIPAAGAGLFGLAFATDGFQAVLGFLETRGDVQILSSPRIATLNNQKAVLKVGTDDYFVTGVTGGSTSSGSASGNTTTLPSITLTSFFTGISLDVTPQIDDGSIITLHVHPSVTSVAEKNKQVDLGTIGTYRFPMASSNVNESDTMVRIQDGNIVAIGGLMQMETNRKASGLPGTTDIPFLSTLFGNKANSGRKKEVVVLIKPSIIRTAADWEAQTRRSRAALDDMDVVRSKVIRLDGSTTSTGTSN